MIVKITDPNDSIDIDLTVCHTVEDVLQVICQKYNYEKKQITLIMSGKLLQSDMKLSDLKISDSSKVIAVIKKKAINKPSIHSTPVQPIEKQSKLPLPIPEKTVNRVQQPKEEFISKSKSHSVPSSTETHLSDMDYAKTQLASQEMKLLLKQYSHFPAKSPQLFSLLKDQDPRLYNILMNEPDLLVEAIVNAYDEPEIQPQAQPVTVQLTQDDYANIMMLQSMGYSSDACIEAYLLCDRNVEMAANYLLENVYYCLTNQRLFDTFQFMN